MPAGRGEGFQEPSVHTEAPLQDTARPFQLQEDARNMCSTRPLPPCPQSLEAAAAPWACFPTPITRKAVPRRTSIWHHKTGDNFFFGGAVPISCWTQDGSAHASQSVSLYITAPPILPGSGCPPHPASSQLSQAPSSWTLKPHTIQDGVPKAREAEGGGAQISF